MTTLQENPWSTSQPSYIGIEDIMKSMGHDYAMYLTAFSFILLVYVLWNNFVRSPSKPRSIKEVVAINLDLENHAGDMLLADEGVEPSTRVKRISRALDEYMILFALGMFYISVSYLLSFR